MSKRFTDTAIWSKPWFRKLTPVEKCAWHYLTTSCDSVGVWDADFELANFQIGEKVEWSELAMKVNGNVEILSNGKWLLVDFVGFQYGKLSEECKPHRSYLSLLEKHGLKGFSKGMHTLQEKEKEKDKVKEKEKEPKTSFADAVSLTACENEKLVAKYGEPATKAFYDYLSHYKLSKGKKFTSDYHTILRWVVRAVFEEDPTLKLSAPKRKPLCPDCKAEMTTRICTACGCSLIDEHGKKIREEVYE